MTTQRCALLVLQPTPFCNIDCAYCYLPSRDDRSRMTDLTVRVTFERLAQARLLGDALTICWHAGEPLVVERAFYERALGAAREILGPHTTLRQSLQTNGTLLTDEWCEFLLKHDITVGLSLDGPQDLHDAYRKTRTGRGTFSKTIAGLDLLQRYGVPYHVLTVLTWDSLKRARELHAFYREHGIDSVAFNIEEVEHAHKDSSLARPGADEAAREFFETFQMEVQRHQHPRQVRELDRALAFVLRADPGVPTNELVEPFRTLTVDCRGNFCSFSPELLGAESSRYGSFVLGNVHTHRFDDMGVVEQLTAQALAIQEGTAACAKTCEFYSGCGGGAPSNKFFEHGNLSTTETLNCRLHVKAPAMAALVSVERLLRPQA